MIESHLTSINWDCKFALCKDLDGKVAHPNNLLTDLSDVFVPRYSGRSASSKVLSRAIKVGCRRLRVLHCTGRAGGSQPSSGACYRVLYKAELKSYRKQVRSFFESVEQRVLLSGSPRKL